MALGSGGSRGLSHIGVIRALEEAGIKISAVAGSSFGALISALYARDKDINRVEAAMSTATWGYVAKLLLGMEFSLKGNMEKQSLRLAEFVKKEFEHIHFYNLAIPCAIMAAKLKSGEKAVLNSGRVDKAVLASMAFPFTFPPVDIDGTLYIDGGMVEAVPVSTVKAYECDLVIAVNLDGEDLIKFVGSPDNPIDVMMQSINIYRHNLATFNVRNASVVIEPKTGIRGVIGWQGFFHTKEIIKSGEAAMRAALPDLRAKIIHYNVQHHNI